MKDIILIPKKYRQLLKKDGSKIKKQIEEFTKTKLKINEEIEIDGESFAVYQAKNILKAFGRGFSINDCLYLLEDEYGLEIINLSDYVKSRERLKTLKGRIIGSDGKTKKFIEKYTEVKLSIVGKTVGIIGTWEKIEKGKEAVMRLIEGSSHKSLYRWLEQQYKS